MGRALLALLGLLACVGGASLAERPLPRLASSGLLPGALRVASLLFRLLALALAMLGLLLLVPAAWSPAVSYVLVGAALAVGWSLRDVVHDVLVGLIFTLERSFRVGQRLRFDGITGRLERMSFRVTWFQTDDGATIAIPNRKLVGATLEMDPEPYVPVEVTLLVPGGHPSARVRSLLRELVMLSPYLAPVSEPAVTRRADDPQRWLIRARLLDPRHADAFRGSLVDLVEEALTAPAESAGPACR